MNKPNITILINYLATPKSMGNSVEKLRKIDAITDLDNCKIGTETFLNGVDKNGTIFMGGRFNGRSGNNLHLTKGSKSSYSLNFDYKNPNILQELRELRDNATKHSDIDYTLKFPIEGLDIYVVNGKKAQ